MARDENFEAAPISDNKYYVNFMVHVKKEGPPGGRPWQVEARSLSGTLSGCDLRDPPRG